jgi:hypothetical protein
MLLKIAIAVCIWSILGQLHEAAAEADEMPVATLDLVEFKTPGEHSWRRPPEVRWVVLFGCGGGGGGGGAPLNGKGVFSFTGGHSSQRQKAVKPRLALAPSRFFGFLEVHLVS